MEEVPISPVPSITMLLMAFSRSRGQHLSPLAEQILRSARNDFVVSWRIWILENMVRCRKRAGPRSGSHSTDPSLSHKRFWISWKKTISNNTSASDVSYVNLKPFDDFNPLNPYAAPFQRCKGWSPVFIILTRCARTSGVEKRWPRATSLRPSTLDLTILHLLTLHHHHQSYLKTDTSCVMQPTLPPVQEPSELTAGLFDADLEEEDADVPIAEVFMDPTPSTSQRYSPRVLKLFRHYVFGPSISVAGFFEHQPTGHPPDEYMPSLLLPPEGRP